MLKLNAIDHININVKNLKETQDFYKAVFGLEIKESGVSPKSGSKYSIIGLSDVALLAVYEDENFDANNSGNINHLGFFIDDFDKAFNKLENLDVKIADYGIVDYGESKSLYIIDPNNIEIELSSRFGGGL